MKSAKALYLHVSIPGSRRTCEDGRAYLSGVVLGNCSLLRGSVWMRRETVECRQRPVALANYRDTGQIHTSHDELANSGNEAGEECVIRL